MSESTTQPVQLDIDGLIATLTINRPEARNAMSIEILEGMHSAVDSLSNSETTVLVITGTGRAFCAGMDLKAVLIELSGDASVGKQLLSSLAELTLKIRNLHQVTVASVNGAAIGGGCGLTCVCDVTISHADAKLGFPEVDLGICPAVIAPWVVRKLGPGVARRAMLMGGVMSGRDGFDIGLVDYLSETRDELDELTESIAQRLSTGGPKALSATKKLLNTIDGSQNDELVRKGAEISATVLATPEAQAALKARLK
ncbi:MAG: enoyl-CoA hydratase/isomerase family protein [Phycisphaerales bacterium]|nr:enoyl-CoA hydratase/isomerase family protein [Phycisphaerales bacterium]